jgi:pyruvate,water dikinase
MTKALLRSLDDIEGADLALVGGKAFRLATLRQQGFKVPQGLILTTSFFEAQLENYQLLPLWSGSPDIAVTTEALSWLANTLKTKPIARDLVKILNQRLESTFGPEIASFAVRSSAIDEDQREHSFAGIHLTELGVPRSALPIAITRCWASALDTRAIQYRQAHGMSIQSIRVAVLIQPMLMPTCSGVGFTINPLTGARDELVIESIWGLGDALVSGDVQPYFYKVANQPPDYPLLEQRAGSTPPPAGLAEQAENSPLATDQLAGLAIQLEKIQAIMGEAQDVEWAWQDDAFYILQTRPVMLPPKLEQVVDQEWTRGSHPEFLPELPSPLFGSLLERTQSQAITYFSQLGLQVDRLGPYVKLILGRPYLNLTMLKRIIAQVGVSPGSVLHTIGHTEPGARGSSLSIDWQTAWQMRRTYGLVLKKILTANRPLKRYQILVDEICLSLSNADPQAPLSTLLVQLRHHERIYAELFNTNLGIASGISALTAIGSSLLAPLTTTPATLLSTLALQGLKTSDGELNQALQALARQARQNEAIQRYLKAAPDDFHDFYNSPQPPPELKDGLTELLATHGHRATYEADMGWPRYADDPRSLLHIIRQYSQSDPVAGRETNPAARSGHRSPGWAELTQATGLNRLLPWRRWLVTPLINYLHRLLGMRDALNSARAKAMAACRQWDLALGENWVSRGWLAQPDDIFWLTLEEVERTLMIEENMGLILSSTVQARKETYQTYAQTELPFNLQESQIASIQLGSGLSPEPASDVMMGLPISPGQARGTVVVLQSPHGFEKLADDIILVMPSTDPAWLPLLHLANGLIVEMGGLLSHGSVIAREYGVPAVANIPQATKRFKTGDQVLVDGSTGIVQLLEPAAEPVNG